MRIKPAEIQVRFSDLDVLGHVNNVVYLSYFEMTRVHYFNVLLGEHWDWKKNGVLLARNEVEYLSPIFLNHKPIVFMHLIEMGVKSFKLGYEIYVDTQLHSRGSSVMVCFDASKSKTIVIPDDMKVALNNLKSK